MWQDVHRPRREMSSIGSDGEDNRGPCRIPHRWGGALRGRDLFLLGMTGMPKWDRECRLSLLKLIVSKRWLHGSKMGRSGVAEVGCGGVWYGSTTSMPPSLSLFRRDTLDDGEAKNVLE
ncbi:hypothetical protein CTRI78_v003643 [Colletotrichum trifolii]|uniref:Uncharacterized protein n=1 Tax=Colletotrichum trifolii TaxID=5466 RepID=A0A4R8RIU0_COLTR|nr:hypothetical protein CTRI78_v003643 [Colletotrichum trifolii]